MKNSEFILFLERLKTEPKGWLLQFSLSNLISSLDSSRLKSIMSGFLAFEKEKLCKVFTHQHLGEIGETVVAAGGSAMADIAFVPVRGCHTRGIMSDVVVRLDESLEQIAEIFKDLPDYSDYNCGKPNNYSLQNAKRKIEHIIDGQLVEKVSLERGGPIDSSGQYTPYPLDDVTDVTAEVIDKVYLEQCLALLSPEDRELLIRHANGETLTALAKDYGYANASGVRKRIERIKKHITEKFSA